MAPNENLRVVVGVDGSAESVAALDWAAQFAERFERELTVLVAWHLPTPHISALREADLEAGADEVVKSAVAQVKTRHPSVDVTQTVLSGAPGKLLVEQSKDAGLLVVGTRRTLGTVASYCSHYALCPVVIVREAQDATVH